MNNLKKIREAKEISQNALAQLSGVNVRMIQHYEQGTKDINKASALTIYKLAQALDVSFNFLMGYKDIEQRIRDFGLDEYTQAMKDTNNNNTESYIRLVNYLHETFAEYDDYIVWPNMISKIIEEYNMI